MLDSMLTVLAWFGTILGLLVAAGMTTGFACVVYMLVAEAWFEWRNK